jgi:crotonobetainyl-CoA:carnitine CoA-transferase CaiB-like acyl-CoA transferase
VLGPRLAVAAVRPQLLADLGATVIAVNSADFDGFFLQTCFWMSQPREAEHRDRPQRILTASVLHDPVRGADVLQHNMHFDSRGAPRRRPNALKHLNPALIYCHPCGTTRAACCRATTRPGGAGGTSWMEGGVEAATYRSGSNTSLGDTGNGYLSAMPSSRAHRTTTAHR